MKSYALAHLADRTLLHDLAVLLTQDRATTAALLAHLAEVDERRLYLRAAYPSMYLYCVRKLGMSEDTAFMRIRAARAARQFSAIYPALADGRLHLSAVVLLAPHLTPETADELLTAAARKTKDEIRLLLAERFPQPDLPTLVQAIAPTEATDVLAARPVGTPFRQLVPDPVATMVAASTQPLTPERVSPDFAHKMAGSLALQLAPPVATMVEPPARAKLAPLSPGRFAWQVTVDQETQDLLRYAQALLGHAVPSGDVATVLHRALGALVHQLERQKFAKTSRSRPRHGSVKGRYIPAEVRRTVWQRDGGRCTFVSDSGKRCESTARLEFDHMDPVASGGQTSVARVRLRCRAHNQYAAECTFGAGFMREKRHEGQCRAAQARERVQAQEREQATAGSASGHEVLPWLRQLGFTAEEARRGAALCAHFPDAPLEQRVRVALKGLAPNCVRGAAKVASGHS